MDVDFNYKIKGDGISLFFQHGMGGNIKQPLTLLSLLKRTKVITMDCRGHGKTPFTSLDDISFNQYADDVIALADKLNIKKAVFGGISMGAGIAMNIAVRYPDRVKGLILLRPAWLDKAPPQNLLIFRLLAHLIKEKKGKTIVDSLDYKQLAKISEEAAEAVLGQLDRDQDKHTAEILLRITSDTPIQNLDDLKKITVPCIVMVNKNDPMHPFEFGKIIADKIPGAVYAEVAPRYTHPEEHKKDVDRKISSFLCKNVIIC